MQPLREEREAEGGDRCHYAQQEVPTVHEELDFRACWRKSKGCCALQGEVAVGERLAHVDRRGFIAHHQVRMVRTRADDAHTSRRVERCGEGDRLGESRCEKLRAHLETHLETAVLKKRTLKR